MLRKTRDTAGKVAASLQQLLSWLVMTVCVLTVTMLYLVVRT